MRRILVFLLAVVLAGGTATVVGASVASAAPGPGQVPVTTTPTALLQPPDPGLGTMTPAANADTQGMFAPQVDWPLIPIHAALAPSGRLVTYGSPVGQAAQGGLAYDDWSPGKGTSPAAHSQTASMDGYNSFCNGLQQMPDGRFLMVGGNSTMSTMFYDPSTKGEVMGPGLNRQRWYSTVLRRPDDRVVVIGGGNYYAFGAWTNPNDNSVVATVPEIGTGTGAWQVLSGADSVPLFGAQRNRWWYPRAYNAPDGSVFGMSDDRMWTMSTAGNGSITDVGRLPIAPGTSGSSVMYDPGRILVAGGGQNANDDGVTAIRDAAVVDINGATPTATRTQSMALQRNWLNLTVLPTGEVLANGGTVAGTSGANPSNRTETWNPATGAWRTGATAARIRTYHSTAALMPSGAVFTGGGGAPGPEDNLNAEMFYPSYLFTKKADGSVGWADRGAITSIAGSVSYGGRLTLGMSDTRRIASASLIHVASVTHSVNVDQRRVPLQIAQNGASVTATLPTSKDVLPPGSYLLQGVDDKGVPTPSQLITISGSGAQGTVAIYDDGRPATTPTGTVVGAGKYDDTDPAIVYAGTWGRAAGENGPYKGTNSSTTTTGSTATLRFTGTGVTLRAVTAPNHGIAAVSVDNGAETLVDQYSATRTGDVAVWTSPGLASGEHTVRVRYTGTKRAAATDRWVTVDRFDVTNQPVTTTQPVSGTRYTIVNRSSGKPLAVAGGSTADGGPVVQQTGAAPWTITSGPDGTWFLAWTPTGKVLDVNNSSRVEGLQLQQWGRNGGANQQWFIRPTPDGSSVTIVNRNSGKAADVYGAAANDGARVVQWTPNNGANQAWELRRS